MPDYFEDAVTRTLQHEGGYVNHPDDPGGETKYGISRRSFPAADIPNLTVDAAKEIYRAHFWEPGHFGDIADRELACRVFDLAVLSGVPKASRWLQGAVNLFGGALAEDGVLGPASIAAINRYPHQAALLAALKFFAAGYYILINNPRFLAGWLARLEG